ncbi:MAG: hypothetical protein EOP83_12805 [Verrucomicrobiaceae bacterium]|nr:MAG: hypothetical protein EOP83_12805 [Verrucomicrobiaceae bacterium]
MKKHIGKLVNTDQRCVVVFMQIPGDDSHALIVSTDNLSARFEQALMEIVESAEGQSEAILAKVLNRRLLPDTGENVLVALHNAQLLRKVHIDQVIMMPQPNMPFSLRKIIEMMGGDSPSLSAEHPVIPDEKFNPHTQNNQALDSEQRLGIARNLLAEAELLDAEVRAKREKAFLFAPELDTKASVTRTSATRNKAMLRETAEPQTEAMARPKAAAKKPRTTKAAKNG